MAAERTGFGDPTYKAIVAASIILMLRQPHLVGAIGSLRFAEHQSLAFRIEGRVVHYSREHIKSLTMTELEALLVAVVSDPSLPSAP